MLKIFIWSKSDKYSWLEGGYFSNF